MSMTGMFATSKAGHDKGQLYIIIKEDEEYVYLTDGRLKPLYGPKKKKKKHIQIIKKTARIKEEKPLSNEIIKHAIREYKEAECAGRDAAEPGTAVARTAHSAELETAVPRTAHR